MWRNSLHSSQFLAGPIHDKVYQKYFKTTLLQANIDLINRAKKLQMYLNELKNYQKRLETGEKTIFSKDVYEEFMKVYGNVVQASGLNVKNGIFRNAGGVNFEHELGSVQIALKNIFENFTISEQNIKQYRGQIQIGSDKTRINFSAEQIANDVAQLILGSDKKGVGVGTKKWLSQEAKKEAQKTGVGNKIFYFQDVQPKTDIFTDGILITAQMPVQYEALEDFAKLFSKARISAKNYKDTTIDKYGISLGKTNYFRIMADFIPTLDLMESREQEVSFQYAIFKRYLNLVKQPVPEDEYIEEHFSHIQNVYELMGVGQNYYKKDSTLNQLNNYLKQGVQFLIINEWNTDNIIVKSTRGLLVQIYQKIFQDNHQANFLHHLSRDFL